MGYKVWGERCNTADFAGNNRISQPIKFHRDLSLKAILPWVVLFNNPVFSSLKIDLYTNDKDHLPAQLLGTLTCPLSLSGMTTLGYALKQIYYQASGAIPVKAEDIYHLVFGGSGYTGTASSCLYIVKAFPEPIYTTGITNSREKIQQNPYLMGVIGEDLEA